MGQATALVHPDGYAVSCQAVGTILPPVRGRGLPKQFTDNHEAAVEKTAYERVKNICIIQTASDRTNTELRIEFDIVGKARLMVKNKAGDIVFQDDQWAIMSKNSAQA